MKIISEDHRVEMVLEASLKKGPYKRAILGFCRGLELCQETRGNQTVVSFKERVEIILTLFILFDHLIAKSSFCGWNHISVMIPQDFGSRLHQTLVQGVTGRGQ